MQAVLRACPAAPPSPLHPTRCHFRTPSTLNLLKPPHNRTQAWLLEVNSSPSMGLDTPLDRAIKPRLVADAVALLDPLPFDRAALAEVLRARTTGGSRAGRRGPGAGSGLMSGTVSEERELCCGDLQALLGGAVPRRYGEAPRALGGFTTCLAPSAFHDRLLKLKRPLP